MTAAQASTIDSTFPDVGPEELQRIFEFVEKGMTVADIKGITSNELEAMYTVAYNFYTAGDYEKAQSIFTTLTLLDHFDRRYWLGLAGCRQMLKEYESAIDAYSFCMLLDIHDPLPPFHAAECHLHLGNRAMAIDGFREALQSSAARAGQFQPLRERSQSMLAILEKSSSDTSEQG